MGFALPWVNAEGITQMLVAQSQLERWSGCRDWEHSLMNGGTIETDYDRACAVDGWTGVIMVGDAQALVLGNESTRTSILTPSDAEVTIVRCICADSDEDWCATSPRRPHRSRTPSSHSSQPSSATA